MSFEKYRRSSFRLWMHIKFSIIFEWVLFCEILNKEKNLLRVLLLFYSHASSTKLIINAIELQFNISCTNLIHISYFSSSFSWMENRVEFANWFKISIGSFEITRANRNENIIHLTAHTLIHTERKLVRCLNSYRIFSTRLICGFN